VCVLRGVRGSPSLLRRSSFVTFCCAGTFCTVKPLLEFLFSDSLPMTEPSSVGILAQVTIATEEAVSSERDNKLWPPVMSLHRVSTSNATHTSSAIIIIIIIIIIIYNKHFCVPAVHSNRNNSFPRVTLRFVQMCATIMGGMGESIQHRGRF